MQMWAPQACAVCGFLSSMKIVGITGLGGLWAFYLACKLWASSSIKIVGVKGVVVAHC